MKKVILTAAAAVAVTATMSHAGVSCDTVETCKFIANTMFDQAQALSTENNNLKDLNAELYARLDNVAAESLAGIADVIAEHNPRDADAFISNPAGLIDGVYNYLWDLRGQLGLSTKP